MATSLRGARWYLDGWDVASVMASVIRLKSSKAFLIPGERPTSDFIVNERTMCIEASNNSFWCHEGLIRR
eukprot:scaffold106_cov246-Pinguiococcus_pyrenoidosus.AAC.2